MRRVERDVCVECGAPVAGDAGCVGNFHALLALEWQIPRGAGGEIAHFYAVSSYVLQHPESMGYTEASLAGLRSAVARALSGDATVADLRAWARRAGAADRVTRREGDRVVWWPVEDWSTTVADVLAGGVDDYGERVEAWAASVLADLDDVHAQPDSGSSERG